MIGKYWYSNNIELHPNEHGNYDVHNNGKKVDDFHVREHKGRHRFEHKGEQ